jgi:hypothetical protein
VSSILRPERLPGDIAPLTAAWVEHHFNRVSGRRIDKSLTRPLPMIRGRLLDVTVPPALEQRADKDDHADSQHLPTRRVNPAGYEADTDTCEERCRRNHDSPQHDQAAGSSTTAVPYATISLIVWPISAESNRIMTMALACMRVALRTILSTA